MSDKIKLNRRRVLGGLVTIGAAGAAVGAGTFAWFNDTETSENNDISAGTLDLTGAASGQIDVSDVVPGQRIPDSDTGSNTISATYASSSTIDPVEVDLDISLSEPESDPDSESGDNTTDEDATAFGNELDVVTAQLTGGAASPTDLTSSPYDVSTVADLASIDLDNAFGNVSPGNTVGLDLAVTFNQNAGNSFQADGVSITVEFVAQQPGEDSP